MRDTAVFMPAIPFRFPGIEKVSCLFSTAHAGDMSRGGDDAGRLAANRNRTEFMRRAGFSRWAEVRQVHGDALVRATGSDNPDEEPGVEADGQFTVEKGVGVVIKSADCQPVLIARRDGGAAAGLHVGWRGNAADFIATAMRRLCREFSCRPDDLAAVRGPSLGPAASEFVNFHAEWPKEFEPWYNPGDKTVNLWALTRAQLERAGVRPERIYSLDLCTRDMGDVFFSYRRKEAGRQVSVIWLE